MARTTATANSRAETLLKRVQEAMLDALAAERLEHEEVVQRLEDAWARITGTAFEDAQQYKSLLEKLDPETEPGMLPVHLLGIVRQPHIEVHHTSAILTLMEPRDPSGLGLALLRAFLSLCTPPLLLPAEEMAEARIEEPCWSKDGDIDRMPDLVIELPARAPKAVVVIENKIRDADRKGQLDEYAARAKRRYPGTDQRRLYLTPEGRPPAAARKKSEWQCLSYRDLACAWRRVLSDFDRAARDAKRQPSARMWALRLYLATVVQHTLDTAISADLPYVRRTRVIPYLKAATGGEA